MWQFFCDGTGTLTCIIIFSLRSLHQKLLKVLNLQKLFRTAHLKKIVQVFCKELYIISSVVVSFTAMERFSRGSSEVGLSLSIAGTR